MRIEFTLTSDTHHLEILSRVTGVIVEELRGVPQRVEVAVSEAVANAILHGNKGRSQATVRVVFQVEGTMLRIQVFDEGPGFDLSAVPVPVPEEMKEGGRGLYIIRHIMDTVASHQTADGHCLEMTKRFS